MSYILEALKKAQAERQLGNAPDIHTPAAVPLPATANPANRKPLLIGLGVGVLVAGVAAGLVWRAKTPAGEPAVLAQNGTPPVQTAPAAPAVSAAPPAAVAAPTPAPSAPMPVSPVPAPQAAPVQAPPVQAVPVPPPVAKPAPAPQPAPAPRKAAPAPAADPEPASQAVYLPAPARAAEPAPVRAPDPVIEENLRTLQQLPESLQREVPKVSVGGYIYSPNPADRLLLVDKTLRREGEELAPGLVLERLMPKYAVMNYRGTRYRVGY